MYLNYIKDELFEKKPKKISQNSKSEPNPKLLLQILIIMYLIYILLFSEVESNSFLNSKLY